MGEIATATNTVSAGSWGVVCFPPGAAFALDIPIAEYESYDLTDRYALLTIRQKGGRVIFTRSSANSEITFSDEGTASQKATISISPATESAADSNITYADFSKEGHTLEASVAFKADANSPVDFQIQGEVYITQAQGKLNG